MIYILLILLLVNIHAVTEADVTLCHRRLHKKLDQLNWPATTSTYIKEYFSTESEDNVNDIIYPDNIQRLKLYTCIVHLHDLHEFKHNDQTQFNLLSRLVAFFKIVSDKVPIIFVEDPDFDHNFLSLYKDSDTVSLMECTLKKVMDHIALISHDEYFYKNFMGKLFKYVKESEYKAIGLDIPILPFEDLFYLDCINRNFKN